MVRPMLENYSSQTPSTPEEDGSSCRHEYTLLLFLSKALAVFKKWMLLTLLSTFGWFPQFEIIVFDSFVQFYTCLPFSFPFIFCKENLTTPLCCHNKNIVFCLCILLTFRCDNNITLKILKSFYQHEVYTKIFMMKLYDANICFKVICV